MLDKFEYGKPFCSDFNFYRGGASTNFLKLLDTAVAAS